MDRWCRGWNRSGVASGYLFDEVLLLPLGLHPATGFGGASILYAIGGPTKMLSAVATFAGLIPFVLAPPRVAHENRDNRKIRRRVHCASIQKFDSTDLAQAWNCCPLVIADK